MNSPPQVAEPVRIPLPPGRVLLVLLVVAVALVVVSFANYLLMTLRPDGFHLPARFFTVNREANFPTGFQVVNLALAAALALSVAQSDETRWRRYGRSRGGWASG